MALRHVVLLLAIILVPVSAFGEELKVVKAGATVDLTLADPGPIFSPDYAEYRYTANGLVETDPATWANRPSCRYARATGPGGFGVFRTCDGADWEGAYFDAEGGWELRGGELVLAPQRRGKCGVEGDWTTDETPRFQAPTDPRIAATGTNYLETTILTDARLAERARAGQQVPDPVVSYVASAALFDGTPFDRRILPLLVSVVSFDTSTPWGAPSFEPARSGAYLDRLNNWLENEPTEVLNKDVVVLLSGWDFFGSTVGLTTVEGACDLGLNGALVYGEGPLPSVAQTFAHELGHTIGMWHDGNGNRCPNEGFVMQAVYSEDGPYPSDFSDCSIADANDWLSTSASSCLSTEASPTFPEPTCGDGRVEGDEACDCGPDGCEGRNPCCNEQTCQLVAGALCAGEDGCCDLTTCAPRPASDSFVCRPARSSCDIPEVCGGGARCPDDAIEPTGESCTDGGWDGACYLGDCVTRGGYCEDLAPLYRFDDPPYDEMCGGAEAGCRVMECVANSACVLTEDSPLDGSECGTGSQCFEGACRPSSQLASPECVSNSDDDGDGVDACGSDADLCPTDPNKTEPGACGCLVAESDCPEGQMMGGADAGIGGDAGTGQGSGSGGGNDGDDVVVVTGSQQSEDSGCSTAGSRSLPTLALLALVALIRRRR